MLRSLAAVTNKESATKHMHARRLLGAFVLRSRAAVVTDSPVGSGKSQGSSTDAKAGDRDDGDGVQLVGLAKPLPQRGDKAPGATEYVIDEMCALARRYKARQAAQRAGTKHGHATRIIEPYNSIPSAVGGAHTPCSQLIV